MNRRSISWADDEQVPVVNYGGQVKSKVVVEGDLSEFREEAVSAQRLVVSRLAKKYVAGRAELAVASYGKKSTDEKLFNLPKVIEWNSGNPDMIVEALSIGRLRCRLSAAMGVGKSTLLASYLARAMDFRVLYVSLEAHALQEMCEYVQNSGIGSISRKWTSRKQSHVCCMTYADFNGYMATSRRADLYRSFELIIFDEGKAPIADVYVAKRFFTAYAPADTHFILSSATVRTDIDKDDLGSGAMGSFKHLQTRVSIDDAIRTGKLVTDYLVDRTGVFVAHDLQLQRVANYYRSQGVDVRELHDSVDYKEYNEVKEWLRGDSTAPRVVVLHYSFGIMYNMPIAFEVVWPYEVGYLSDGDKMDMVEYPMCEESVIQVMARTGRGIVDGSGGIVMSPERLSDGELPEAQRFEAFVKLCAGLVRPLRTAFWEKCYQRFPEALPQSTALTILKMCLPVEIAAKYLGQDGRVARRFCSALNAFSHPDHFLMPSDDEFPVGYDSWSVDEYMLGVGEDGICEKFRTPFVCLGELKVILFSIDLMSQGRLDVPRWRPTARFSMGDGYDSDEDQKNSRFIARNPNLRRINDRPISVVTPVDVPKAIPWSYRAAEIEAPNVRQGGFIDSERCKQALLELEKSLLEYSVPVSQVTEVVEEIEGTAVPIVTEGFGDVESPGGSVVCTLPVRICEHMNTGLELSPSEFVRVVAGARKDIDRFVASKLFDCFAGPWESLLCSLLNEEVVKEVVARGVASDVYMIVDKMRARFSLELCSVLANSNVFKVSFFRVFRKIPTMDATMRAIRAGRFDGVAQTDGFIRRVKHLKDLIDQVLLAAENRNVFLPNYITNAQRNLPLRGKARLGYLEENVFAIPEGVSKRLLEDGRSRRGGTFSDERSGW